MRQLKISSSITNRTDRALDSYLKDITLIPMIGPEEEIILAKKIKAGDKAALDRLVSANLRFVVSVAKKYQNQGLALSDLTNEGNLGLIKAAERFDETKGFKFISYAVWWIRQSILQAIAEQSRIMRLPLNQVSSLSKISKASSKLEQEFEREPTPLELAEAMEITLDKITDTISHAWRHASLDAPLPGTDNEENTLLDRIDNTEVSPDQKLFHESLSKDLTRHLKLLSLKQRDIIVLFFGLGGTRSHSLEEIGEKFNLTRERVRQIKDRSLEILRDKGKKTSLRSYLG